MNPSPILAKLLLEVFRHCAGR